MDTTTWVQILVRLVSWGCKNTQNPGGWWAVLYLSTEWSCDLQLFFILQVLKGGGWGSIKYRGWDFNLCWIVVHLVCGTGGLRLARVQDPALDSSIPVVYPCLNQAKRVLPLINSQQKLDSMVEHWTDEKSNNKHGLFLKKQKKTVYWTNYPRDPIPTQIHSQALRAT